MNKNKYFRKLFSKQKYFQAKSALESCLKELDEPYFGRDEYDALIPYGIIRRDLNQHSFVLFHVKWDGELKMNYIYDADFYSSLTSPHFRKGIKICSFNPDNLKLRVWYYHPGKKLKNDPNNKEENPLSLSRVAKFVGFLVLVGAMFYFVEHYSFIVIIFICILVKTFMDMTH